MAVELTGDELAKIANNRRSPRPEFFDANTGGNISIGEDFESFLILQSAEAITKTLTWLGTAGLLSSSRLDRNAIAFEALVSDIDDRETRQAEVSEVTTDFNEWKALFRAGKFSDVPEVGLIITDMQATGEQLFVLEERNTHLEQIQKRVTDRLRQGISTAQLQQLNSWPTPLLAY